VTFFQQATDKSGIDYLTPADGAGLAKLDEYCKMVTALPATTTAAQWHGMVDKFLGSHSWVGKLSLDTILENFGFSAECSKRINEQLMGGTTSQTWGQYSLRWVSKSFDVIGVEGSLSDVVNLIFAMKNIDGSHMNINDIVQVVTQFRDENVRGNSAANLWLPTHVAHDAELDDALALVLVHHMVQVAKAEPLQVLVQLPAFTKFQRDVAPKLEIASDHGLGTSTILYDDESRNKGPIAVYWIGPAEGHE
jgi:hypothetical protein